MSIWNQGNNSESNSKFFNGGKAGECVANVTVESAAGKTGPSGNPLPTWIAYLVTVQDPANPESRPLSVNIGMLSPTDTAGNPTKPGRVTAALKTVQFIYEAAFPSGNLPEITETGDLVTDANAAITAAMNAVVGKGTFQARIFAHFEDRGKRSPFLNVRTGFSAGFLPVGSETAFDESHFTERLVADAQPTPTAESTLTSDDLPFN